MERNNSFPPWNECTIPLCITLGSGRQESFMLMKRCFIDTKTYCIDTASSPPYLKRIFELIKTFWRLKAGGFKLTESFPIEQESFSPGIEPAL